ncbi:MAG: hypothetical protein VYE27_03955 [Pseudomonadota bacterium]|nr:hypothetical protein [Pseudomonadota bacterium]
MKRVLVISLILVLIKSVELFAANLSESDRIFQEATTAVKERDYIKAINIFEKLAEDFEHDAQYNLAVILQSGKGRPQDYRAALKWAWLAHLGGIDEAESLVDDIKEILPDPALKEIRQEVKDYIEQRAEMGKLPAIEQMGDYFLIVPEERQYKDAYLWFLIASAFQIDGTFQKRDNAEKQIEGKDILQVQAKALEKFNKISENRSKPDTMMEEK